MYSFVRFRDITETQKCRNRSRDSVHTHRGDSTVIKKLILITFIWLIMWPTRVLLLNLKSLSRPAKVQKWKCVRPSAIQGKGQFFRGEHCLWCGLSSKFSDSCLHSCCRTEEIKFSIKPITRKPIQNLWLLYKIKYKTLSVRSRTYVYSNFSPQKENTCEIKNIVFRWAGKCVRFPLCGVRAWDSPKMRESHARCVRLAGLSINSHFTDIAGV